MAAARRGTKVLEAAPAFSSAPVCTPLLSPHSQHLSSPVTLSLLPLCHVPSPQLFYPCLPSQRLPSSAIASSFSTTHTSPVLYSPQPSHSLFQAPGYPRSCLDYYSPPFTNQFCQTVQHLSPPEDKSCSQPLNHPLVAASTLLFKGDLEKISHCQQISVLQRFLIMYLPLPFSCPAVGKVAEHLMLWPIACPLLRRGAGHGVVLAVGTEPWQEKINEVEGAGTHDWCQ